MSGEASTTARADGARKALGIASLLAAALFVVVYRQVLGITQRQSWPPPPEAVTPGEAEARDGGVRRARWDAPSRRRARLRVVDGGHHRALGRGRELLPAHLRGRRGRTLVGAHPHVRLARRRRRNADGRPARAEARRGSRGARHRRRVRLQALRASARDVHAASPTRAPRSSSTTSSRSIATVSSLDDQHLDWRQDEVGRADHRKLYVIDGATVVDRRCGHRGSLRERRLPRRDGARHGRRRATGAGGLPDELSRSRRPAAGRAVALLPRAGRRRLDADRPRPGDPGRLRRRLAGDPRADRRRARRASTS